MLKGAPTAPVYIKKEAPSLVNQVPGDDLSYNQLTGSGWRYWAQTDWSGGFQELKWKDNASFKDGQGIDVISEYGTIRLQNDFTSAIKISGGYSYNSHTVHDGNLILGVGKSNAAKIFKITSAHTITTLSALAGITKINAMSRFGDQTLIGMTRTSGSLKTLAKYLGGNTISGFRNLNSTVRAVKGIGVRAYISEYIKSLSGDQLLYCTNLSAFTSAYNAGKNRRIVKIEELQGVPYFFVEDGSRVDFFRYDELTEKAYPIYSFNDLTSWGVTNYLSMLIITGTMSGKKVAFAFNGARLWQIFKDQLKDANYDFSKPFEFDGNLHIKGAQWDGEFWFPGLYGKFVNVQYTPFANFANRAYAFAVSANELRIAYLNSSKFQISGYVVSSNFGHHIGAVDKLINAATINCKPLENGQTIELFYSKDDGINYSSIGKLSYAHDGAIASKTLFLPSGTITKNWLYKASLVGPGNSTPVLQDISFQYRPIADSRKLWHLIIDAGDHINLLNNQREERDGKAIMAELWLEKEAKRTVVFEDVNSFSAKIVSAMTSAATSALVNNTRLFPPRGRMRIFKDGIVEEMTYTSADGGVIKGINRAQKGTQARAYSANDQIDNFYNVIITNLEEFINNTDQNKTESFARITILEV